MPRVFAKRTLKKAGVSTMFFFGIALLVPLLLMFPRVVADRRTRLIVLTAIVFAVGLSANVWLSPHYAAPFTAGFYVLLLQAMRDLRVWRPGGEPAGLFLVRALPVACVTLAVVRMFAGPLNLTLDPAPTTWYGTSPVGQMRAKAVSDLQREGGQQLAIVRYAAGHSPLDEWVYNEADIDRSKVVWAREMDEANNAKLLRYLVLGASGWSSRMQYHPGSRLIPGTTHLLFRMLLFGGSTENSRLFVVVNHAPAGDIRQHVGHRRVF